MSEVISWRPIDTAPQDKPILGFWLYLYPGDVDPTIGIDVIEWDDSGKISGWFDRDGVAADGVYTHWMPLPAPPLHSPPERQLI
jgi:hypothetical protein